MKKTALLFTLVFFSKTVFTQSVYDMIPFSVFGNPYADTMLITKTVLVKAGISAYSFDASEWKDGFNFKTVYVNREGNITETKYCSVQKDSGIKFCIYDTVIYDARGRMTEQNMYDGRMELYQAIKADYINEREIKYAYVMPDTSILIVRFNSDGKIREVAHKRKGTDTAYSRFYYNGNGFLDSAKDAFAPLTFVFKRKEKKGHKIIELSLISKTTFIYNNAGQLIESSGTERYHKYDNAPLNQVTKYYYNADGTLSKIVRREKYTPNVIKPQVKTIYYSYTKY